MRRFASLTLVSAILAAIASLAGCASSSNGATPTTSALPPTFTATAFPSPRIHVIPIPGYFVTQNIATAHGFVFDGAQQDGQSHPNGTLYYYRYDTRAITAVAVAMPDPASGVLRDIHYVQAAGDIVAYLKADNTLAHWELDATNVATGSSYTLDSYGQDGLPAQAPFPGSLATDGARIAWSSLIVSGGVATHVLKVFDIASNSTQTIAHDPTNGYLVAIHGATVAYIQEPANMDQSTAVSIWRMSVTGGTPTQVATTHATVNLDLSDQYLVWDVYNGSTGAIQGIALNSGANLKLDEAQCMRPLLAGTYLLCQVVGSHLMLIDLRTGASVPFGQGEAIPSATVGDGRVVWLNANKSQAEYVTLPTN